MEAHSKSKPATDLYYHYGMDLLLEAGLGALLLNEITQHAVGISPNKQSCHHRLRTAGGLRILLRALNLAEKWTKKLTAASAAYQTWVEQLRKDDWPDAAQTAGKLEREYLERPSDVIQAGWKNFQPYRLRHTAFTLLANAGCDPFTLARIAGHSSITITQR